MFGLTRHATLFGLGGVGGVDMAPRKHVRPATTPPCSSHDRARSSYIPKNTPRCLMLPDRMTTQAKKTISAPPPPPSPSLFIVISLPFTVNMDYKPYSAQSREDLQTISKQHGDIQVILQLDPKEITSSASRWKLRHLISYRLLVCPEAAFLPMFKTDHNNQCPMCNGDQACAAQKLNPARTRDLMGENPRDLFLQPECELMQLPDGFFWVALARAARPELADQARVYPQRERKQVWREGYINSANAIPGSSSPTGPSSSEFEGDTNEVDEDEHDGRRSKPEEVTVYLVSCFFQYALNLCLLQHSGGLIADSEVRPRVERRTTKAYIAGDVSIIAEDDGGICQMRRRGLGWEMQHPYLALLEAKKAFRHIHFDEKTGKDVPVVSNENLAQCFGEALIAWKGNQKLLRHG